MCLRLLTLGCLAATLPLTLAFHPDPCGPVIQIQDGLTPNNTCNRTVSLVTAPAPYGAMLTNDGSGNNITWENCVTVVYDACAAMTDPSAPTGKWNWTDPGSGCVMGFWLPQYNGSAPVPTYDVCFNNIYTPMAAIGADFGGAAINQVAVNVKLMPNNYETGEAVNVGYPSYTITHWPLQQGPQTPLQKT